MMLRELDYELSKYCTFAGVLFLLWLMFLVIETTEPQHKYLRS